MLKILIFIAVVQIIYGSPTRRGNDELFRYSKQTDSPWLALLEIKGQRCGGSLINERYVITAAHCFDEIVEEEEYADIKITLGEWKIDTKIDCEEDSDADVCDKVAVIPLKSINIHESYDKVSKDKNSYDIAIITLKRPPRKSEIIDSIKLPTEDSCDYSGKLVTVTGFGEIKKGVFTNKRKKTDVSINTQDTCKRQLGTVFNRELHICGVGSERITTCKGDSGSPATAEINGEPILQGIVSFGHPTCERTDIPSAFLNIGCFIPWIEEQISGVVVTRKRKVQTTTTTTEFAELIPPNSTESTDFGEDDFAK